MSAKNALHFKSIESLVELFIIPLIGDQLIGIIDDWERIDQMCA